MIAAEFPVLADRFYQILDRRPPVGERFPESIAHKSAFNTDILYRRRRGIEAVVFEDFSDLLKNLPCGLARDREAFNSSRRS